MDAQNSITLPVSVISPTDIARLTREMENLDEFFRQAQIRTGGETQNPPRYSLLLDELVVLNKLNLLDGKDRENLVAQLRSFGEHAPVIHMSFSVDPPGPYVQKIVSWLRSNISPQVLVRVGLQPNIGAGCVVRTTNKSFDMSLREYFKSKRSFFVEKLHEAVAPKPGEELAKITLPEPRVTTPPKQPAQEAVATVEQSQSPVSAAEQQSFRPVFEDAAADGENNETNAAPVIQVPPANNNPQDEQNKALGSDQTGVEA